MYTEQIGMWLIHSEGRIGRGGCHRVAAAGSPDRRPSGGSWAMARPDDARDGQVMLANLGHIRRVARHWLPSPDEHDDCVQAILLRLWCERLPLRMDDPQREIARIARNVARNWRRRGRDVPVAQPPDVADGSASAQESLEAGELCGLLMSAVDSLGPSESDLLYGFHFDGRTYADLEAQTGLSRATVRARLYRARRLLRATLLRYRGDIS